MADEKKVMPPQTVLNPLLPTVMFDQMAIISRNDGINLLRMFSTLPEGMVEQARLVVGQNRMKAIIDALCKHSGYYPVPPAAQSDQQTLAQKVLAKTSSPKARKARGTLSA